MMGSSWSPENRGKVWQLCIAIHNCQIQPFRSSSAQIDRPRRSTMLRKQSMNMEGYKLGADQLRSDTLFNVSGRCRHYTSHTVS